MPAVPVIERQECQRPAGQERLPGGVGMGAFDTHRGHQGMVQVIPLTHGKAGQLAQPRAGAVGGDHQRRLNSLATIQLQTPASRLLQQLGDPLTAQQDHRGARQAVQYCLLHSPVLDDMTEPVLPQHAGIEADLAGAFAVPDTHMPVGAAECRVDARPGIQISQNILRGGAQRADPRIIARVGGPGGQGLIQRHGIQHRDTQRGIGQRPRQGRTDHTGTDDNQIELLRHGASTGIVTHPRSPMPWRANRLLSGGSRSSTSSPALRPVTRARLRLLNSSVR